jgi:hypothetical protein
VLPPIDQHILSFSWFFPVKGLQRSEKMERVFLMASTEIFYV